MSKMILYHGSKEIVGNPIFGKGTSFNDYGLGFYCTESIELAKEWACSIDTDGYVNKYEIDLNGLKVLDLTKYSILNWLAILLENRIPKLIYPIAIEGKEYLLKNFLIDYKEYDIIIGYRADDSYFSFARAFVSNEISLSQLEKAMKLGHLGEQVVLKSEKAFSSIIYTGYEPVNNSIYYPKRKSRDEDARITYNKEIKKMDLDGIYIRDLIKEGIKDGDSRIQ